MSKPAQRTSLDAFDYVDARRCEPASQPARAEFSGTDDSLSPFRRALRPRDNLDFIDSLVVQLAAAGIPSDMTESVAASVLLDPAIALVSGDSILQASVFEMADDFPMRVRVSAAIDTSSAIRSVSDLNVNVLPVDLADSRDVDALAVEAAQFGLDFPMPKPNGSTKPRFSVRVLGKPGGDVSQVGRYSWSQLIRALEAPFDVDIAIITDQAAVKDAFPASTRVTVALDPAFVGVAIKVGKVPTPPLISSAGHSAEQLAADIAALIRACAEEIENAEDQPGRRDLRAGEHIFHRKIGSSAAFDKFGEPCKPCAHGEDKFVRYHAAPKAEKGMARRYTNFVPSMLYHCGKGYGCGVYAVFAPSNLK